MTPAQALDQIIPGWTASLADKYSPAFIINLGALYRTVHEDAPRVPRLQRPC
jgi:hypothetical protein